MPPRSHGCPVRFSSFPSRLFCTPPWDTHILPMLLMLSTDRNVPSLSPSPCQTPWFTEGLESAPSRSRQSRLGPLCPDPVCSFVPSVNRHLLAARLLCARPWGAQRRSLASCLRAPPPPPRSLVGKRDLSGEGEGALDWRRRERPVSPEEGTAAAASEKASPRRVVWVQSCGFQEGLAGRVLSSST